MTSIHRVLRVFLSKPLIFFTASRYLSYALLFVRGLLIAKFLGPYFFGIWGFITLYQQYLTFTSLGLPYAISTELALLEPEQKDRRDALINTSFTLTLIIFLVLMAVATIVQLAEVEIFRAEGSYRYAVLIFLLGALQHFRELFVNIFRVFNQYGRIAIGELLIGIITLAAVFFFNNDSLILALLIFWTISLALSILLLIIDSPFNLRLTLDWKETKLLFQLGIPLLLYSISYYLMTLSSRTIITIFYDLETIGYYTFAHNITNATLLGLNAASWFFYPTILSKLKEGTDEKDLRNTVSRVFRLYSVAVVLIVYLCILGSPLFYIFLEKYRPADTTLNVLLLSQAILATGFVFNTLAIARKKHNHLALISLASALLCCGLSFIFASLGLDFVWIAVATLVSFTIFTAALCLYASGLLKVKRLTLIKFFPFSLLFSMAFFLVGSFNSYSLFFYLAGLAVYVAFNGKTIKDIMNFVLKGANPATASDAS